MSATIGKRKRARKACIPCARRKRRCDNKHPCNMCVIYEYPCSYADKNDNSEIPENRAIATANSPTASSSSMKRTKDVLDGGAMNDQGTVVHRSRPAESSAAMAFPDILSAALRSGHDAGDAFKMHSFAFNFGLRPDEASNAHRLLGELISEDDLTCYSHVYFAAIGPVLDIVDPGIFAKRFWDYYHRPDNSSRADFAFSAVAAGVAALGSFLSPKRFSREPDLVSYAKAILDDPATLHKTEVDHVVAWGLRVLYLRATTRPNNAWIASCTNMHLCESVGLHDEVNIRKMADFSGANLGHDAERLRRIFWICWAGHALLSYECDRSSVTFRAITTEAIMPASGSVADLFVQIAHIIPGTNSRFRLDIDPRSETEELLERLRALHHFRANDTFLLVTKADLAFCFYRRAYQLKMGIPDQFIHLVIEIGNAAVGAAEKLARQGRFFWNVIGSVFHYICVLFAIDTPNASRNISTALKGLETLVLAADTSHTREALAVVQNLFAAYVRRKQNEIAQLDSVQSSVTQPGPEAPADLQDMGFDMDWDQFLLEPYISMFSSDSQL